MDAKSISTVLTISCGSRTCKPNSVRLAAGRSFLWAVHCCAAQATYPEVVAHRAGTRSWPSRSSARQSLPIWSCSVWGLPCPPHYCGGGALLPHLFTLTGTSRIPAVYFLWHSPSNDPVCRSSGVLPDVIRHTALRSSDFPLSSSTDNSDRPAQLPTASLYSMAPVELLPAETRLAASPKTGHAPVSTGPARLFSKSL